MDILRNSREFICINHNNSDKFGTTVNLYVLSYVKISEIMCVIFTPLKDMH